jgi:hypothetical protein
MQVTRDVALTAPVSVQVRVVGIRALVVYRRIIEHTGTAQVAAHRLVRLLDEVSARVAMGPDGDLATRHTEWAAAHIMSADPIRAMLAGYMVRWMREVAPVDFAQEG